MRQMFYLYISKSLGQKLAAMPEFKDLVFLLNVKLLHWIVENPSEMVNFVAGNKFVVLLQKNAEKIAGYV